MGRARRRTAQRSRGMQTAAAAGSQDSAAQTAAPLVRRSLVLTALTLALVALVAALSHYVFNHVQASGVVRRLPKLPELASYPAATGVQLRDVDQSARTATTAASVGRLGQVYHANLFYREAVVCYGLAEELQALSPTWPYYQGVIAYDLGDHDQALACFQRAQAAGATNPCVSLRTGDIYLQQGHLIQAAEAYWQAISSGSHQAQGLYGLARIAQRQDRWDRIVQLLEQSVWSGDNYGPAYRLLISAYRQLGQDGQADQLTLLAQSKEIGNEMPLDDPAIEQLENLSCSSTFLLKQATQALWRGERARQLEILKRAVAVAPDDPHARLALADCYQEFGGAAIGRQQPEEIRSFFTLSLQQVQRAIALDESFPRAHIMQGVAQEQLGQLDQAIAAYRQALAIDEQSEEAHRLLGLALAAQGDLPEAERHCRRAVELSGASAPACDSLAHVLARAGRWEEAIEWFQQAQQQAPLSPIPYFGLARSLAAVGRTQEAIALVQQALASFPQQRLALEQLLLEISASAERSGIEPPDDATPSSS